ncbi:MAG: hypothetical protein AAGJ81_06220 [Verrucomicrobiota bacterium]
MKEEAAHDAAGVMGTEAVVVAESEGGMISSNAERGFLLNAWLTSLCEGRDGLVPSGNFGRRTTPTRGPRGVSAEARRAKEEGGPSRRVDALAPWIKLDPAENARGI